MMEHSSPRNKDSLHPAERLKRSDLQHPDQRMRGIQTLGTECEAVASVAFLTVTVTHVFSPTSRWQLIVPRAVRRREGSSRRCQHPTDALGVKPVRATGVRQTSSFDGALKFGKREKVTDAIVLA